MLNIANFNSFVFISRSIEGSDFASFKEHPPGRSRLFELRIHEAIELTGDPKYVRRHSLVNSKLKEPTSARRVFLEGRKV